MTEHLLLYAGLLIAPAALVYGLARAAERFASPRVRRAASPPAKPDLARLTASLRRLDREAHRVRGQRDLPARGARLRTVSLAYDDTLCACCAALGLPAPGTPPLASSVRLQTEALLAQHGVEW